jgi:hypothetical protein
MEFWEKYEKDVLISLDAKSLKYRPNAWDEHKYIVVCGSCTEK